ncbi:MAG: ribosome biogenesis factor YjgA [Burkholderiaceae bacterium]
MSRKPKKGYYVRGEFVAEGSELDVQLKAELKGTTESSRTDQKRESDALQTLGEDLLELGAAAMLRLNLPEKLHDAIADAKKITNFEGKRRQLQFVGKLMRKLERAQVIAARAALDEQHSGSASQTLLLHEIERWRADLLARENALADWLTQHPGTDAQQLRALLRQTRKDALPAKPGLAPRQGRAYRDIYALLRSHLLPAAGGEITPAPIEEETP